MTEDDMAKLIVEATPRIRAQARRGIKDISRADDLVQDALLRMWRNAKSVESPEHFAKWSHVVTANAIKDSYKKQKSSSRVVLFQSFREAGENEREADWEDEAADVERRFIDDERRAILRAKIARLPRDFRRVLELITFDELSHEEVSAALGCSVGAVKTRASRARQALLNIGPINLYARRSVLWSRIVVPLEFRVVIRPAGVRNARGDWRKITEQERVAHQVDWRARRASKWVRLLLALREKGRITVDHEIGVVLKHKTQHSKLTMAWNWSAQHDGSLTTIVRGQKLYPDYGTLAVAAAQRIEALHAQGAA